MTQTERRRFLLSSLLAEAPEYRQLAVPDDAAGQEQLLRALLNVRPPRDASPEFLQVQDEYLRAELAQKGVTVLESLTPAARCGEAALYLWQGDITTLQCDAIVNAANSGMTGCYVPGHRCIDNCIHTFAGVQLRSACARLMAQQGHEEPTGQAKLTPAFNLPCRYVLHTVGPIVTGRVTARDRALLASCYCACLTKAAEAGLSTSAGFTYAGERFRTYFSDFASKYGFTDMYSGGFYPYSTMEEYWAYWSRYIYINRYQNAPKPVYGTLFRLVQDKDYFIITTNVDHCFQKAGFDKKRLFYTQGDYGLFQCSEPCCQETFDNEALIRQMVEAQGYHIAPDGQLTVPENTLLKTSVPSELVPHCPHCGKLLTMNLRSDDSFVEDAGWHAAAERYSEFLRRHEGQKILFFELGVGYNTPVIIKYPFWRMTARNPNATYVCINKGEAVCPNEIAKQSLLFDGDIAAVLAQIK